VKIIVYNQDGVNTLDVLAIDLFTIKSFITPEGEPAGYVEAAAARFKDEAITIWLDEEGRLAELPVWAVNEKSGEDFCGNIVVTSSTPSGKTRGLSLAQIAMVEEDLKWVPGVDGMEPEVHVTEWKWPEEVQ
jgi:hypothetical protein